MCVPPCEPQCVNRECGGDGCGGLCGFCEVDEVCSDDGQCVGGAACECDDDEICIDGICRTPTLVCSNDQPAGICPSGRDCISGFCEDVPSFCAEDNLAGLCRFGELCVEGDCHAFVGTELCDDRNPCTLDFYDYIVNGCSHAPLINNCSDGNGCTLDHCEEGECRGEEIPDCFLPPTLDPYPRFTNEVTQRLSGGKDPGTSIQINGQEALPQTDHDRWRVTVNLQPGENHYSFRMAAELGPSAERAITIVYDITPPVTRITPMGGDFLDGITITLAASEPARMYYTTDGSTPDEWSPFFYAAHTHRIYNDTLLKVRARDLAGNWEEDVQVADFRITSDGNHWKRGGLIPLGRSHIAVERFGHLLALVGGSDGHRGHREVNGWDPQLREWVALPPLPVSRSEGAIANVGGHLYFFGGQHIGESFNNVFRLLPGDDEWTQRRPMPTPRRGARAEWFLDRVYVVGGLDDNGFVSTSNEMYLPGTDNWRRNVPRMPRPRYGFDTVIHEGKIYCIGGADANGELIPEIDVFDAVNNEWYQQGRLPTPRMWPTVTLNYNAGEVADGITGILVSGGQLADGQPTPRVEEYLLDRDEWVPRTPLPEPRYAAGGAETEVDDTIDTKKVQTWLFGGRTPIGAEDELADTAVYYNSTQDHVRLLASLPEGRFKHAVAALANRIFVIGGRDFQEETRAWAFEPETGEYRDIRELPGPQSGLVAVTLFDRIWAIGGSNAFGVPLPYIRSYHPGYDRWETHATMTEALGRRYAAAAVVGDEIWVAGGEGQTPDGRDIILRSSEIYNAERDEWRRGPFLPEPRYGAVGVAYDGAFYLVGGRNENHEVVGTLLKLEKRDWERLEGQWEVIEEDLFPVANAPAVVINGQLAVFGGRMNDGTITTRHWRYDLRTERLAFPWIAQSRLLPANDFMAATIFNGNVYLVGGNGNDNPGPNGLTSVYWFNGKCINGVDDFGEGIDRFPELADMRAGCGWAEPLVRLPENRAYGHHGTCEEWNDCTNGRGCADAACFMFGHGPAHEWNEGLCSEMEIPCEVFRAFPDQIDANWQARVGCDVPVAYDIVCERAEVAGELRPQEAANP